MLACQRLVTVGMWMTQDPNGYGAVAKALSHNLVAYVDQSYDTGTCRSARDIAGLSMGGFCAVQFAFEKRDRYAAAISLSGSVFSKSLR